MSENPVCQRWIPSRIRELKAYQVASAQGLIKLDAMENPYVWDEGLRDAWLERLEIKRTSGLSWVGSKKP
jgi:hypothetical protein